MKINDIKNLKKYTTKFLKDISEDERLYADVSDCIYSLDKIINGEELLVHLLKINTFLLIKHLEGENK